MKNNNFVFFYLLLFFLCGFFFIPIISQAETDIDGLYYLTENTPTSHWQNNANDRGYIHRDAPSHYIGTYCGTYVLFFFDEPGVYTQTNHITNVYYHFWWYAPGEGELDYNTEVDVGGTADPLEVNTSNAKGLVNGYYLYAGKQNADDYIDGEDIYYFAIQFTSPLPKTLSSPSQISFIIINLPDDETLQGQDSDSDTINDYDELFTYYTNPYDADTDNDGFTDPYEIQNGMNPNDSEKAPFFGRAPLKEFSGSIESERLGVAVSHISDKDGDGKEDIIISKIGSVGIYSSSTGNLLQEIDGPSDENFGASIAVIRNNDGSENIVIGAPNASWSGEHTGSVYIYSTTGSFIRRIDSTAATFGLFGYPVVSIGDHDNDGSGDIIIGAPHASPDGKSNAGSVFIYSSSTGEQLREFDGANAGDNFGSSVSRISDQDDPADGKEDIIIGAPYADPGGKSTAGSVFIYSSSTGAQLQEFDGANAGDNFGYSVSRIGDQDDDGKEDIIIGARGASPNGHAHAGSVYLYSSSGAFINRIDGAVGDLEFGGSNGSNYGNDVSNIADQNGDGKEDIIMGAPATANERLFAGLAHIYSSSTGNLLLGVDGSLPGDYWASEITPIGDQDGDGKEDLIVGSSSATRSNILFSGAAAIYSSSANIHTQTWAKNTAKTEAFDLDDYFTDPNNTTIPNPNQIITYTASILDNFFIDVVIDGENKVSFYPIPGWAGMESVVFTARDSTGLASQSNTVTLTVSGENELFEEEEIIRKNCFIATAAYGTAMAEEVHTLRQFRNEYLLTNPLGKTFVRVYYKVSPPVAEFIRESPLLRTIVGKALIPWIWISEKAEE